MSVSVDDVSSPLSEGQSTVCDEGTSSSDNLGAKNDDVEAGQDKSEPTSPKLHPMAFTVDFGESKKFDNRRLEELAKKSQARHQRVQSMSAGSARRSPTALRPPMSVKLPRKAQGYNSEGYFSSDQEDGGASNSVKVRNSPLAQNPDKAQTASPVTKRQVKSPNFDLLPQKKQSKSPIVDSIMTRSENFTTRQSLNLPLNPNGPLSSGLHETPRYGNLSYKKHIMMDIADQSPEVLMLTDISSPELDILTPDNGLSTPETSKSPLIRKTRAMSETPDLLFKKCPPKPQPLYIDDDIETQSNNSSTGTYTIEADNYTEEQKARMSIDRSFGADLLNEAIDKDLSKRSNAEADPALVFDYPNLQHVITKEPRREVCLRSPLASHTAFEIPNKVSKDKNVLEISCCYEPLNENELAVQTSKQIKSTRSYLEKIKSRVRTITEKTFPKSPPKQSDEADVGSFTSVTTSGVLSMKKSVKIEMPIRRRCSLTKSEIDQTDYVHRLSRESSVPVSLPSSKGLALEDAEFESTALRNAQKALRDDSGVSSDITPDQVVGKLSYMSLSRCKGDKTWIQDWAESVKNYNNNTLAKDCELSSTYPDRPPLSPRHLPGKPRSPHGGTPTKIPSPVGTLLHRRTPDLIPPQDTESYLLKTQNAITNLQAKLQSSRANNFSNIPSQLTSSLISEKTAVSRLPLSQLSRSNSLNYRLRRKDHSGDGSPLRSPGHYVITGSTKTGAAKALPTTSRSLDTDRRHDSNMNSPTSDRGLCSNSSDDRTLSNKPQYRSPQHRPTHPTRHKSHETKQPNPLAESNSNQAVCLKAVLKSNAIDAKLHPRIEQTRYHGDGRKTHQRVFSDNAKQFRPVPTGNSAAFGVSIKRSSSFNTVNRNNNYIEVSRIKSRRSSGHSEYKEDYLSDESDNGSFDKSQDVRFKRATLRGRIDSPDLKSVAPANSPRCPNTPEMQRKFGPGLVRNTGHTRERHSRMSEPPASREERAKTANHQSRRTSDPTRQAALSRLTKSRSSTREVQPPRVQEKGQKKPSQHRSSSALATKEVEFSNWKKRSSYDPMKAAQEGRKRQQMARRQECNKDDLSSPSQSSPVHRSQSFHTTNIADLETLDYSSEDDQMLSTLPIDPMVTSTHSDILDLRPKDHTRENLRRQAMSNDVVLSRNYVTSFQVNQPSEKKAKGGREADKRKTYIVDDITPTRENVDFLPKRERESVDFLKGEVVDKRKTFILDSDTNSTTNGSSPRNSSIFSHEKNSLTTGTSDTECESGTESAPVVMRHQGGKKGTAQAKQRYSGDYSMSSSTTSIGQQHKRPKEIQPRYLDISKYKAESSPKNFLRRDPSKTYVGVLNNHERTVSKGSAQHYEMEQKKQELEKWKRRASYDPRKAAAQGKTAKATPNTARA